MHVAAMVANVGSLDIVVQNRVRRPGDKVW